MAPMMGDENGLFWTTPVRERRGGAATPKSPRALPPVPDTGWSLPTEQDLFPDLLGKGPIAIDCETYDPDLKTRGPGAQRDGYIVGVAVGTTDGWRQYYPIRHEQGPNLPAQHVLGWLDEQLSRPNQPKVGANLLYDLDYLTTAGVRVEGPFWDIQVAEPLLDETALSYSLETLAQKYLGEGKREDAMTEWLTAAFGKDVKRNIWRAPAAVVGAYAEGDVDLPLRIFAHQRLLLEAQGLWDLFEKTESRLAPLLLGMRQRGVRVDLDEAERLRDRLKGRQDEALGELRRLTSTAPDIWAAESLAKMYDAQGITYPRTPKGAPSFTKTWLTQQRDPISALVQTARQMDKLRGTFVEGYILNGHVNGRIHCSFHQLRSDEGGTVSGRFSSSAPNLQNIPSRTAEGQAIRQAFIAEEGEQWWKFDWSQIEYRLIVHYAARLKLHGAPQAANQYRENTRADFHQVIADMTGLSRADAKNLNFGLAYGQGVGLLCHNLGVDIVEGRGIISDYHARAPFIRALSEKVSSKAAATGEVRTLMGRLRRFNAWEAGGKVYSTREEAGNAARRAFLHKALNALIQGSAADIMKVAMVQVAESGVLDVLGFPSLTVHDELDGSLPPGPAADEALAEVKNIMETCVALEVPLVADGGLGSSWGDVA